MNLMKFYPKLVRKSFGKKMCKICRKESVYGVNGSAGSLDELQELSLRHCQVLMKIPKIKTLYKLCCSNCISLTKIPKIKLFQKKLSRRSHWHPKDGGKNIIRYLLYFDVALWAITASLPKATLLKEWPAPLFLKVASLK